MDYALDQLTHYIKKILLSSINSISAQRKKLSRSKRLLAINFFFPPRQYTMTDRDIFWRVFLLLPLLSFS